MTSLVMWNQKYETNECLQTETDSQTFTRTSRLPVGGVKGWEVKVSRYKP